MHDHEPWRDSLFAYIRENARPPEKFGHQPRLYALARQIGESLAYDDDILCVAAWLHDLGVFTGHRPEEPHLLERWDLIAYAVATVPGLLRAWGFPEVKIEPVLSTIRTHQPQHTPVGPEATILRDADILEQLGAVGILRTVCKIGRDTRFNTFTDAVQSLQRAHDTLPALIRLPQTRTLAEPRIAALDAWLKAVNSEAGKLLL